MTHFHFVWLPHLGDIYFRRGKKIPKGFYRMTVKALVMNAEWKILLLREGRYADKNSEFYRDDSGLYDLPGGGIVWWDGFEESLYKELFEEIGLQKKDITIAKEPLYTYITELDDRYYADEKNDELYPVCMFIYPVRLAHFDFRESPECTWFEWVSIEDFPKYQIWTHSASLVKVFQKKDFPLSWVS